MIDISKLDLDYTEMDIVDCCFENGDLRNKAPYDPLARYIWMGVKSVVDPKFVSVLPDLGFWEMEELDWRHMSEYSRKAFCDNLDTIVDAVVSAMLVVKRDS